MRARARSYNLEIPNMRASGPAPRRAELDATSLSSAAMPDSVRLDTSTNQFTLSTSHGDAVVEYEMEGTDIVLTHTVVPDEARGEGVGTRTRRGRARHRAREGLEGGAAVPVRGVVPARAPGPAGSARRPRDAVAPRCRRQTVRALALHRGAQADLPVTMVSGRVRQDSRLGRQSPGMYAPGGKRAASSRTSFAPPGRTPFCQRHGHTATERVEQFEADAARRLGRPREAAGLAQRVRGDGFQGVRDDASASAPASGSPGSAGWSAGPLRGRCLYGPPSSTSRRRSRLCSG